MCLDLRYKFHKPWNKSNLRWKLVRINENGGMASPYQSSTKLHRRNWMKAKGKKFLDVNCFGFHIFTGFKSARALGLVHGNALKYNHAVVRVKMRGFLASGWFENSGRSETWREMRIVGKPIKVRF